MVEDQWLIKMYLHRIWRILLGLGNPDMGDCSKNSASLFFTSVVAHKLSGTPVLHKHGYGISCGWKSIYQVCQTNGSHLVSCPVIWWCYNRKLSGHSIYGIDTCDRLCFVIFSSRPSRDKLLLLCTASDGISLVFSFAEIWPGYLLAGF